jgi:hypothetical protein
MTQVISSLYISSKLPYSPALSFQTVISLISYYRSTQSIRIPPARHLQFIVSFSPSYTYLNCVIDLMKEFRLESAILLLLCLCAHQSHDPIIVHKDSATTIPKVRSTTIARRGQK